jgi:hypothetical protein
LESWTTKLWKLRALVGRPNIILFFLPTSTLHSSRFFTFPGNTQLRLASQTQQQHPLLLAFSLISHN